MEISVCETSKLDTSFSLAILAVCAPTYHNLTNLHIPSSESAVHDGVLEVEVVDSPVDNLSVHDT